MRVVKAILNVFVVVVVLPVVIVAVLGFALSPLQPVVAHAKEPAVQLVANDRA